MPTTPIGEALWAKIIKPDTKFDPDGVFSCTVLIDPASEEGSAFIAMIDAQVEESMQQAHENAKPAAKEKIYAQHPYKKHFDKDENPTNLLEFSAKTKAKTKDGNLKTIGVFDSEGTRVKTDDTFAIGNGSKIRIKFNTTPYSVPSSGMTGISVWLAGVQVIELVEFDTGFDKVEGGWQAPKSDWEMADAPF